MKLSLYQLLLYLLNQLLHFQVLCLTLFGLHHVDAFPIDTHVKQLLDKYYSDGFDFERYKGVAGIIQQYLFYFEL